MESDALSNALVEATIAGFAQPAQRELLAPYAAQYFDGDRAGLAGAVDRDRRWPWCAGCSRPIRPADAQPTLAAADAWLAAHADAAPALRRLVLEARDDLARALRGAGVRRDGDAARDRDGMPGNADP